MVRFNIIELGRDIFELPFNQLASNIGIEFNEFLDAWIGFKSGRGEYFLIRTFLFGNKIIQQMGSRNSVRHPPFTVAGGNINVRGIFSDWANIWDLIQCD
ncbi:Uncharacterised protein [Mycobacteroides abscessus subsp. abscessus]|nr:Uncharacterised protein [Mycobacteroides abscessus subsp. abscessus]